MHHIVHCITSSVKEKYKFRICDIVYKNCFEFQNKNKKQPFYTECSEFEFFSHWIRNSMNNLSSYCGLTHSRMSASDTDLPVNQSESRPFKYLLKFFGHFILNLVKFLR